MATALRPPHRHRYTVAEYERMGEAGIVAPDARVELIGGDIIDMAPIGSRHAGTVAWLTHRLVRAVGEQAIVWCQSPIVLDERNAPQPDLALLRPRRDGYRAAHPGPADVLLVVEVADTTLAYDRDIKGPLYAAAGIPEFWLIDVEAERLLVHRAPAAGRYATVGEAAPPAAIAPAALPETLIDLAHLFGA